MPTPAQIEAVARAIEDADTSTLGYERCLPYDNDTDIDGPVWMRYRDHATAAIAAYEATLPKASTDDGMAVLKVFRDSYNDQAREFGVPSSDTHTQGESMCQAAGAFAVARAVRARLEGRGDE